MPRHFLTSSNLYATASGYLNLPPRVRVNIKDCATGSYLSIKRTTGFKLSDPTDPFNDTRSIDYSSSSNTVYPFVLNQSDTAKYRNNWIATPNTSGTFGAGVEIAGVVKPGVSDQDLKFSVYQEGAFTPFNDHRIDLNTSKFYMTGTDPSIAEGFSSPLDDKVQIKIHMFNSQPAVLSRYAWSGLINDVGQAPASDSTFYQRNYTGFRYYNFDTHTWDEIGKTDPGTGHEYTKRMWYTVGESDNNLDWHPAANGMTKYKTYQFAMSNQIGYMASDYAELDKFGYSGIGSPTVSGGAPFSGSYHATGSQLLSMSDYINRPFLLEKAVLRIPFQYKRRAGNQGQDVPGAGNPRSETGKLDCANRDIDNFVFFVYRQRSPTTKSPNEVDSPAYCSGSVRSLVMSASLSFYNSFAFNESIRTSLSGGLLHSPSFSHDIKTHVSYSLGATPGEIQTFDDTISVNMIPGVTGPYRGGGSRFPTRLSDSVKAEVYPTINIQDFWPGGTTIEDDFEVIGSASFGYQNASNYVDDDSGRVKYSLAFGNTGQGAYGSGTTTADALGDNLIRRFEYTDFRPYRNPAGLGDLYPEYITPFYWPASMVASSQGISRSARAPVSTPAPYILFPEDKLIFGFDTGISMIPALGTAGNPGFDSGIDYENRQGWGSAAEIGCAMSMSFGKIKVGGASLTLFGSFVKESRESLFQLNQNLTSDAIHEDMHSNNTVLDQYQIEPRKDYSGSYIDNCMVGVIDRNDGATNLFRGNLPSTVTRTIVKSNGSSRKKISDFYGVDTSKKIIVDRFGLGQNNVKVKSSANDGFLRGVALISDIERSYDTVMPNIVDFASRSGMDVDDTAFVNNPGARSIIATLNGNLNETQWHTPTVTGVPDRVNKKALPYDTSEERMDYQNVILIVSASGLDAATLASGERPDSGTSYYSTKNCIKTTAGLKLSNPYALKAMMFKNGISVTFTGGTAVGASNKVIRYAPPYTTGSSTRPNHQPYGAQSFLYGIENITPLRSRAIFRSDQYGQFRDMLEQRKSRRYFNRRTREILDAVVECRFVSSSDGMTMVSPYDTHSSNMSQFCTSSSPYKDGKGTNRGLGGRVFSGTGIFLNRGKFKTIF